MNQYSGIYIIRNILNGKFYIGQAQHFRKRWNVHRHHLRNNKHSNRYLQRAWNKDGEKAFEFLVLEYCAIETLNECEQMYLDKYAQNSDCYNIALDANSNMRGLKHSPETRKLLSEMQRGENNHNFGKPKSDEVRRKISEANRGKIRSEEVRRKMSDARRGKPAHNRGKSPSEETRKKMSDAQRGRLAPNRGKPCSIETRKKIGDANRGHICTEETRRKLSEAAKKAWALKLGKDIDDGIEPIE